MLVTLKDRLRSSPLRSIFVIGALLSLFFTLFAQVDLWASSLFFDGTHFPMRSLDGPRLLRRLGILVPRLAILGLLVFLTIRLFIPSLKKYLSLQTALFLLSSAIIAPGIIVNLILKSHWGRARPSQTDLFGGDWAYSKVWVIANNCQSNCSFVSGEGAMGFWLLGLALLVPAAQRLHAFWLLGGFGALISFNRIAFGGHYLSDILLSWAITAFVMIALWRILNKHPAHWLHQEKLEASWDRAGLWIKKRLQR
ncbi:MAG: phosphatase PAP2 family protein [Cohaesibacter sp.]|nr:phosphatase PAP2 family protein [Cohaesibacter sp.]MCV6601462.1 phosphatase PAP2 family protein [Cohaesibacter sp.]